jgi:hypothetical protein
VARGDVVELSASADVTSDIARERIRRWEALGYRVIVVHHIVKRGSPWRTEGRRNVRRGA